MFAIDEECRVYKTGNKSLETHLGKVSLSKKENISNTGKKFYRIKPSLSDEIRFIKRGPQTMKAKDIGFVMSFAGVKRDWRVADAGAGSGVMSFYLANAVKEVYSYERDERFLNIFMKNVEELKIKNITIVKKDVYDGIIQKDLDMVFLDLPEPWRVNAGECLKKGGFLVAYLPSISQVSEFIENSNLKTVKVCEILQRDWKVSGRIIRPEHRMLGHTAFLVFQRNL